MNNEQKTQRLIALAETIESCQVALAEELKDENLAPNTADDISARYWLMTFLEPLNRKELKSIIDGFLVQMLNDDQAKKIVKFLLTRFPHYYKEVTGQPEPQPAPEPEPKIEVPKNLFDESTTGN